MGDFAVAPCGKPQENDENCEGGQENLGGKPLLFSLKEVLHIDCHRNSYIYYIPNSYICQVDNRNCQKCPKKAKFGLMGKDLPKIGIYANLVG